MQQRTCNIDGCDKPLRAKGMCVTHYNRQQPNRHRKVAMLCGWCGTGVQKDAGSASKFSAVYCTLAHRDCARKGTGDCSQLPRAHWARWFGASSVWQPPTPNVESPRFVSQQCADCDAWFITERATGRNVYCSARCARRKAKRARRAREHNAPGTFTYAQLYRQYTRQGRACAYCKQAVNGAPDPEHVLPLSRGGRNDTSNIVAACRTCNSDKGDLTLTEWKRNRERRGAPTLDTVLDGPAYRHIMHGIPTSSSHRLVA